MVLVVSSAFPPCRQTIWGGQGLSKLVNGGAVFVAHSSSSLIVRLLRVRRPAQREPGTADDRLFLTLSLTHTIYPYCDYTPFSLSFATLTNVQNKIG